MKQVLVYAAIGGGPVIFGALTYYRHRVRKGNFENQGFFHSSMKLLQGYTSGVQILGKPINARSVDMRDRAHNHTTGLTARMKVPLDGSNKSGFLHSWSTRPVAGDEWEVNKLDLEVDGHTWTFFINPNASSKYSKTITEEINKEIETELTITSMVESTSESIDMDDSSQTETSTSDQELKYV